MRPLTHTYPEVGAVDVVYYCTAQCGRLFRYQLLTYSLTIPLSVSFNTWGLKSSIVPPPLPPPTTPTVLLLDVRS